MKIDLEKRNESMAEFFNRKAEGYDNVHGQRKFMSTKEVLTAALPEGISKVLDLGCGTGLELYPLVERFPAVEITGVDISESMIEQIAQRPFADKVRCVVGDFFAVDMGEGYDAAISTSALHHFAPEDKARLYKRVFESLRPGGWFLNSDLFTNSAEETEAFYQYFLDHPERPHNDTPLHTQLETEMLTAAGFAEVRFELLSRDEDGTADRPAKEYKLLICRKPE